MNIKKLIRKKENPKEDWERKECLLCIGMNETNMKRMEELLLKKFELWTGNCI